MKPKLPNPFKPSKLNILSMLVTKLTSFLNHPLTIKQLKHIHALILINGLNHLEPTIITQIISNPSNHYPAAIRYLRSLIRYSKHPNIIARTSVIQFLYKNGKFKEALGEYLHMQRSGLLPCSFVVATAIKACMRLGDRVKGIRLHGQVYGYGLCGDVHVGTSLVGFYSKFGDTEIAAKVFDEMSERNAASCLILRYLELGNLSMAEHVFSEMGCKDIDSWNYMVSWYAETGDMEKAIATFGPMPVKTSASWAAMVTGYIDSGNLEIARNFYDVMPEQSVVCCIKMIDGYSNNGDVESAREVFDEMGEKDQLLYDAMIACYANNGRSKEAFQLFDEMLQPNVNIKPNTVTLANVINLCSQFGNLIFGSWIHETLMKQMRIIMDDQVGVALIELYAKCGRVDKAFGLFHGLQKKHAGVYTTMILACSKSGWNHDAIKLFEEMLEANICPNLVTFSGLLTALNHAGTVQINHGLDYANSLAPQRPSNHKTWVGGSYNRVTELAQYSFQDH
ncbi:putative tetratricopeptide-like helical domain superfamily [Helianthus annuus]|nr:putative tetratricopeptide-like helical domain superfamily [Helianthus annuus]